MSNVLGPAHVTACLKRLFLDMVNEQVGAGLLGGLVVRDTEVTTIRPDKVPEDDITRINIYLYQVTPNSEWENADAPSRNANGDLINLPKAAVDLHYLFSFHGGAEHGNASNVDLFVQMLMAGVVRLLHESPWINIPRLVSTKVDEPLVANSNMELERERVRFTPRKMTLDELTKLWTVFPNTPFHLSLTYTASVVFIDRIRSVPEPATVLERKVEVETMGGGSPTPSSVAGLGLWLRADTGLVLERTSAVGIDPPVYICTWSDQSGRGRHASQQRTVAGNRTPTGVSKVVGRMPALRFDGADDHMSLNWEIDAMPTSISVCAIVLTAVPDGDVLTQPILSFDRDKFWELALRHQPALGTNPAIPAVPAWILNGSELAATSTEIGDGWRILYATYDAATPRRQLFMESVQVATDAIDPGMPIATTKRTGLIGATRRVEDPTVVPTVDFFRGDLAELIVYERALSDTERNTLFRYLKDQYGIS